VWLGKRNWQHIGYVELRKIGGMRPSCSASRAVDSCRPRAELVLGRHPTTMGTYLEVIADRRKAALIYGS
jgi:hypothetical protein